MLCSIEKHNIFSYFLISDYLDYFKLFAVSIFYNKHFGIFLCVLMSKSSPLPIFIDTVVSKQSHLFVYVTPMAASALLRQS